MKSFLFIVMMLSLATAVHGQQNSFKPGMRWLDTSGEHINAHGGGILFHEGKYFWYGEHKGAGKGGNTALMGVSCYTSQDLYNWKNEGIVLEVEDDPSSDITKGCILERPKVVYNATTKNS